jgi:hypothetical protein
VILKQINTKKYQRNQRNLWQNQIITKNITLPNLIGFSQPIRFKGNLSEQYKEISTQAVAKPNHYKK